MAIDQELLYLVDLFDDDDSVVAKAVDCRIMARGEGVIKDLCTLMKDATMADKKEV
ncbi:MAG: hypothetical protein HUJ90_02585, partial [Bacteroidales bacterium]|nr:hypothetical protein [Bacteroidales bacterium]